MKNANRLSVLAGVLVVAACSSGGGAGPSAGGQGGQAKGGSAASGSAGSGGVSGTAGKTADGTGGKSAGGSSGQGGAGSGSAAGAGGGASGGQAGATLSSGTTDAGGAAGAGGAMGGGGKGSGGSSTGGAGSLAGQTGSAGAAGSGGGSPGGATSTGGIVGSGGRTTGGVTATGGATVNGGSTGTAGSTGAQHWVGTWTASPYVDAANPPPAALANGVLRQIAHVSLGGSQLRVQFSNLSGNGPVTINSAHIALCKATGSVDSTIDTATDKALAFAGTSSVTIAQGKEVWSDSIDFTVPAQGNITITTAFGSVPSSVCGHAGSRTTSYIKAGSSDVSAASLSTATPTDHWFYISGIDVMADASAKGIVAIGDSITDGRGTDTNKNNRWTDILAARLQGNPATANVAMTNQGIGATNLVGSSGTAAQARFNRDVLGQSGVKYVIVFDGVNDIGGGTAFASMKTAYDDLISRAHAKGLLIYGATILPFGGNSYYSTAHESVRQQVNTYIKSGAFDGIIDFDAALTDGGNPPKLQTTYATWAQTDGLHPGPTGYKKMGDSADLTLFTK